MLSGLVFLIHFTYVHLRRVISLVSQIILARIVALLFCQIINLLTTQYLATPHVISTCRHTLSAYEVSIAQLY